MGVRRLFVASVLVAAVALPAGALAIAPPVTFRSTGAEQRSTVPLGTRLLARRSGRLRPVRDLDEAGAVVGSVRLRDTLPEGRKDRVADELVGEQRLHAL